MVGRTRTRAGLAAAVVVALAAAATVAVAGGALSAERILVVEDADTGDVVLSQPVANGTTVALEYTHSVERSRVYDGYAVRGEALEQTRMEFESYGWGLPADADVRLENGTFVYDPPGAVTDLSVSPGEIAGHRLHVGDETYDLVERSGGESVTISVERRSPIQSLP